MRWLLLLFLLAAASTPTVQPTPSQIWHFRVPLRAQPVTIAKSYGKHAHDHGPGHQ